MPESTPQQPKSQYTARQFIWSQFAAIVFDMFAAVGICLIGYGIVAAMSGTPWPIIDPVIRWTGPVLTLVATIITAASIYFPINHVPPKLITKICTAPVIIVMCLVALVCMVISQSVLPETVLQGFSILGLSGGLMRLVPRIHDRSHPDQP
jgi:hypothetical protein